MRIGVVIHKTKIYTAEQTNFGIFFGRRFCESTSSLIALGVFGKTRKVAKFSGFFGHTQVLFLNVFLSRIGASVLQRAARGQGTVREQRGREVQNQAATTPASTPRQRGAQMFII